MALPKAVDTQRDFTAGEIDATAKRRDDDDFVKKGMRQLSNARTLNTGGAQQRPGRNLLQSLGAQARVEEILIAPGTKYRFCFTAAHLTIYDTTGTQVFAESGRAWAANTLGQIVFAVYLKQVFITFPGVVPEALTFDGVSAWSSASYAEAVFGGQKRTPFYRIAPNNITLQPGTITGTVNLTFVGGNVLVNGMIGTRIRFCGRQMTIATVSSPTSGTAIVNEPLPPGMSLTASASVGQFNAGDVIIGNSSGAKGIVTATPTSQLINFAFIGPSNFQIGDAITGSTSGATGTVSGASYQPGTGLLYQIGVQLTAGSFTSGENIGGPHTTGAVNSGVTTPALTVQILPNASGLAATFTATEIVAGPSGSATLSAAAAAAPQPVTVWDQEVMNAFQGWPSSVFVDQGRLGFCDFPSVPGGIAWSAIGIVTDLYVGANPSNAMFELAPGKSQVLHVVPGPESAEFAICDNALYYIPISPTNPLRPGSVQFQKISSDGAAAVQPRAVGEIILYVDQGLSQLYSIVATGAYNRPYESHPLTDLHSHLFNGIKTIALPTSVTQFPERYAYVLNGDGTIAVGKYALDDSGKLAGRIGWVPWNGAGAVEWVSALNDVVLFCTGYPAGAPTAFMLEQLDATLYLDASLPVNAIPAALTPPGGKGPLWWLPGATVDLMDGLLPLGPHATDANGFLVPIFPGEDLTSATLRAGFTWTGVWEPFVLTSQSAQGADERMKKRRISRLQAYVMNSTGFRFAKFYSGALGPNLPAQGAIVSDKRIPAYNQDDDATLPPPLREQSYAFKPLGRAHDPRAGIIKDTPGPLTLVEMAAKASI